MKRRHVAAAACLILGGLLAYIRFNDGDIGGAIRTGIIFGLFGLFAFCYHGKVRARFRPIVVMIPVIYIGFVAYRDFMNGDIVWVIIAGIVLMLGGILQLFQDTPVVREKIRPWLSPVPYIALVALFIMMLFLVFKG